MSLENFTLRLLEATLRFEQCLPLFGALNGGEAPVDGVEAFASSIDDDQLSRLWPDIGTYLKGCCDAEEVIQALVDFGKNGWLVQVATPVMRPEASGAFFSWSSYYTHWLYADSMEGILDQAEAWARERRAAERMKAGLPEEVAR